MYLDLTNYCSIRYKQLPKDLVRAEVMDLEFQSDWLFLEEITQNPANIYLFTVNNRNARKMFDICSKLTMKTQEQDHWRRSVVFIANFEHISRLFLVFLLLTLNK